MSQTMVIEDPVAERTMLFIQLYQKAFPLVAKHVSQMGGSFEDAKDVFQDALVIYYEKLVTAPVTLQYSEQSYLLGIARHLWAKKNKHPHQPLALDDSLAAMAAEETPGIAASGKLLELLHTTGQKCMQLLRAFYYDKLPLGKIAGLFVFPVYDRPPFKSINAWKRSGIP